MKSARHSQRNISSHRLAILIAGWLLAGAAVSAADFTVTSPGFAFTVNGVDNPVLTLVRGKTYTFAINTTCGFHPFRLNSPGTDKNGICTGLLTYTVPTNDLNYSYDCTVHGSALGAQIITVEPPPPPTVRIVSFDFSSNVVLRSLGTNTFNIFPEYKTNLNDTNWFALTVQTNRFLNGTNETICGRPPGSNVFLRLRETSP